MALVKVLELVLMVFESSFASFASFESFERNSGFEHPILGISSFFLNSEVCQLSSETSLVVKSIWISIGFIVILP